MPSYHHSEGRRDSRKGGDFSESRNTDPNPKYRKLSNRAQKQRFRKEKSTRINRKDYSACSLSSNHSSSSSPMRSPWATPQKLQNKSAWSRSPERPDGFYRKSSDTPYESQSRENHGSEDSNSCNNHNDDEYKPYVYEKIDGWDTDTDDEETRKPT
ncbi:hypothetical protein CAEBREN_25956 [Caenorhabditis brenneri]|uniref:Uncharacterized protein n=1 Tax=Caenorhabditis brenneri TaxID=135651 RepID=G0P0D6_CAEBE|nr:hypothetical protein CAEBREN_25956 [Caenorhabditis brenneri]